MKKVKEVLIHKMMIETSRRPSEKEPARGSLAWYKASWKAMSKDHLPDAILSGLAQLSYENKQMRKRLEALESCLLAQVLGRVEIDGELHLLSCSKREDRKMTCTCSPPLDVDDSDRAPDRRN